MNVVIIGATQGLGLALTRKFLLEGHTVAAGVVDRETPIYRNEWYINYKGEPMD